MTAGRYDILAEHRARTVAEKAEQQIEQLSTSVEDLHTQVTQLQTTIRIAGAIVVLVFSMVASAAAWTMSSALQSQERLEALAARVDRHPTEGHAETTAAVADVRAEQRAMDAGVRSELAAINGRLERIERALLEDRETSRRR